MSTATTNPSDKVKTVSIVVPLFNEEQNIPVLVERLENLQNSLKSVILEFVFVDDKSSDRTYELARKLSYRLGKVRLIRLAKNAGSHAAIMCGLLESTGDCALFLAGDLQDPPELLGDMLSKWEEGFHVVWGVRESFEKQPLSNQLFSRLYWSLANFLCDYKFPKDGAGFFLTDRKVIDCIGKLAHQDIPLFLLIAQTGFSSTIITYDKVQRSSGRSGWTLKKKLQSVAHTLLVSTKALRVMLLSFLAVLNMVGVVLFAVASFYPQMTGSFTCLLVALSGSMVMILMAGFMEYLARNLKVLGALPRFIICERDVLDHRQPVNSTIASPNVLVDTKA